MKTIELLESDDNAVSVISSCTGPRTVEATKRGLDLFVLGRPNSGRIRMYMMMMIKGIVKTSLSLYKLKVN